MAIKTGKDYLDAISKQKRECYMFGKKCNENVLEDPMIGPCARILSAIYDMYLLPAFGGKWHKESSLIPGEKVCIMNDLLQTPEEWINRITLMRQMTRRTTCVVRCIVTDTLHGTWASTWECDRKYGTKYHEVFKEFVKNVVQKKDLISAWAVIDAKGHRGKTPGEQVHKDVAVHIVDKKKDGIVVRGCKANTTFGPYTEEIWVTPGDAPYTEKDKDYAVSFCIPEDTKGLKFICRPPGIRKSKGIDFPISSKFGWIDAVTVFEDVFVPKERVFLCGEWDFANRMWDQCLGIHLGMKSGCMAGTGDLMAGIANLMRKYNGLVEHPKFAHVKADINEMLWVSEMGFNNGLGAIMRGEKHPSGVFLPHPTMCGSKYMTYKHKRKCLDDIMDMTGGIIVTGPSGEDFENPETRKYLLEALSGDDAYCTAEERLRMIKLAEDLTASEFAGIFRSLQGNAGGPPWAQMKRIWDATDFEDYELTAKVWAGIEKVDKIGWGFPG